MKKFTIFLLCTISILINLLYGFNQKYNDSIKMHSIGTIETGADIFVKTIDINQDEFINSIESICEKYNISFVRTDIMQIDGKETTIKSVISHNINIYDELNISLIKGHYPQSKNEIISTFKHSDSVGQIHDLFNDNPTIICSIDYLTKEFPINLSGTYHINCKKKVKDHILNDVANVLKIDKSELLKSNYEIAYEKGPVEILFISIFLILLIYILTCLFFPTSYLKTISVLKLLGYKSIDIWFYLNKHILSFIITFIIIINFVQKIFIPSLSVNYFIHLFLIQIIFFFVTILLSLSMQPLIKKYTISAMLKGYYHVKLSLFTSYILKLITFICIIFSIPLLSISIKTTINEYKAQNAYLEESNYLTLSQFDYINDEFQQLLNGTSNLKKKIYSLFNELETTADARFINISTIDYEYYTNTKSLIDPFASFSKDSRYPLMKVNQNALNDYKVFFNDPIREYFSEDSLSIVVPDKYKEKDEVEFVTKAIMHQFEYMTDQINIHYYPTNNQKIFSQNIQLIDKNQAFIENPIFICLHDQYLQYESYSLLNSAISNPIRIKSSDKNIKSINKAIINNHLENNNLKFESVFDTDFKQYLKASKTATFISILILSLVVIVNILSSYFIFSTILISRKKEIFVKKMIGYPQLQRYKNEMIYFFTIYFCSFILITTNTNDILSKCIFILFITIDIFINNKLIKQKEKTQLNSLLKGEN